MHCKNCGFLIYPMNPFSPVKWEHGAVNKVCLKPEPNGEESKREVLFFPGGRKVEFFNKPFKSKYRKEEE